MRKRFLIGALLTAAVTAGALPSNSPATATATGSGAPSGAHYTLNIIGVPKEKSADMTGSSGHRIFVPLSGKTKINLSPGEFQVLDANGTDGSAAFQLPVPATEIDGESDYSVFARALGTPGGKSTTTTCAVDPTTGEDVCSTLQMVLVRDKGKSSFTNVSRELLYVYVDYDDDGDLDFVPLFSDALRDYYWSYDNNGLRVAQLRFYDCSTDPVTNTDNC